MKLPAVFKRIPVQGDRAGFTLPEMLLVIAIGTVLMALTAPVLVSFYQNQLVADTAFSLEDTLLRARANAMAMQDDSPYGVKTDTSTKKIVLFKGNSYAARDTSFDQVMSYPGSSVISGNVGEISFGRLSGTTTAPGTWTVTNGGFSKTIEVTAEGFISGS